MTPAQIAQALKLASDAQVAHEWGKRMGRRSGGAKPGAGRPKKIARCERCGYEDGVVALRRHRCAGALAGEKHAPR